MTSRPTNVHGTVGMWHGISFSLTHELRWHFSLWVPLEIHLKSCAFPSWDSGLLQIQVGGSMHEPPSNKKKSSHAYFSYLHLSIWKLNFPPNPHVSCDHIFKGIESHGRFTVVSLFMQLFLTLASLSTMGNGGNG